MIAVFVDTNVPLYAVDASEAEKKPVARAWIQSLWHVRAGRISVQVLHEFYVNATRLDVSVHRDHNLAVMEVREFGADFIETVEARLRDLVHHGLDCIYVDLPLAAPPTRPLGGQLESLGFFFGGVFPNRAADGDVLRLQYLNGIEVDRGDVAVASDFGQDLLDYVMVSRTRVGELTALQPGGARRRGKTAKLSRQPR